MIKKRLLRTLSAQLLYQAALEQGLDCTIESSRFNLFSIKIDGVKVFIKGTQLPVNPQSSCLIASNKFLSKRIFKQNDILVPKSWLVQTVKEAKELILSRNIFPCVIKPIFGAHGDEIYANVENPRELNAVLAKFSKVHSNNILIEEHIVGTDYRLLVVGNNVVAVTERIPAHVVGDGIHTIKELINTFNANPLVGIKYEKPLCKIRINFELLRTLRKSRLKLSSITADQKVTTLKQNANISSGGISKDVSDIVNQSSKDIAVRASRSLGMEFSGVDIIFNPKTHTSYVLEVNDCPGIDIHHFPVIGDSQNVARDIVKYVVERKNDELSLPDMSYAYKEGTLLQN